MQSESDASNNYSYTSSTYSVIQDGHHEGGSSSSSKYSDDAYDTAQTPDDALYHYKMIPDNNEIAAPSRKSFLEKRTESIVSVYKERDWNIEFQKCIAETTLAQTDTTDVDRYSPLSHLAQDFIYASKLYAKVIISELYVPPEHKTIQPVKIGGIAGGDKYICGGILFKFALDTRGLYGGDEFAMKAAGHELKSLQVMYQSGISLNLNFPLMTVIDYRGYRVVAEALLPITKESIIYGSSDAGQTVHNDDIVFNDKMAQIAALLNLKGHMVGPEYDQRKIYGPADIEGHKSYTDGKYYVVDYARLMPPQVRLTASGSSQPTHLYQLLRPELVLSNSVPLSSDALTALSRNDPNRKIHNDEVIEASKRMFEVVVPEFARKLELQGDVRASKELCDQLHRAGINIRHLGVLLKMIRPRYTAPHQAILTEMTARVMKDQIKKTLRDTMRRVRVPSEEPYRLQILNYLNEIFVRNLKSFWSTEVKDLLKRKFNYDIPLSFCNGSLLDVVDTNDLLMRFQQLSGVKLTRGAVALLLLGTSELTGRDVVLKVTVRTLNVVDHAAACSLSAQALLREGTESQRLFSQAVDYFAKAMSASPLSAGTLFQWGLALRKMTKKLRNRESILVLRDALLKYEAATSINKIFYAAHMEYVDTAVSLLTHEGRMVIPDQLRSDDTKNLFASATRHFGVAIKLEQLAHEDGAIDTIEPIRAHIFEIINKSDVTTLLCLLRIVLGVNRSDLPNTPIQRRHSITTTHSPRHSAKSEVKDPCDAYLTRIDKRIRRLNEVVTDMVYLFDSKTLQYFFDTANPNKLRSLTMKRGILPNELLSAVSVVLSTSSGSTSSSSSSSSISSAKAPSQPLLRVVDSAAATTTPVIGRLRKLELVRVDVFSAIPPFVTKLKTLTITSTKFSDDSLKIVCQSSPSLTYLDLSGCTSLTNKCFDIINAKLTKLKTMTMAREIQIGEMSVTKVNTIDDPSLQISSITNLDLSGIMAVTKSSLSRIADTSGPSLTSLSLHHVKGVVDSSLLPLLRSMKNLTYLNLSSTLISAPTLRAIGQSITTLKVLELNCCGALADDCGLESIFKSNANLEFLDISSSFKISDATFAFLGQDSTPYPNFKDLNLYLDSQVSDASIKLIAKAFPNLQKINLTSLNKVSNHSLAALGKGCPHLISLHVPLCILISDDGLAPIFKNLPNLTSLSISECRQISNKSILELTKYCTGLQSLDVSKTDLITPAAIQQLLQRNTQMKELIVLGCKELTGEFLFSQVRHNCKKLDIWVERGKKMTWSCLWELPREINFDGHVTQNV